MVKVMGYFDDAIAEREESLEHGEFSGSDIIELSEEEYLEHGRFGSFRKTHKYIDRIWKGGKWVYRYAKKTGDKYITGKTAKADLDKHLSAKERYEKLESDRDAKVDEQLTNRIWKPDQFNRESLDRNRNSSGVYHDMARRAGLRAEDAKAEYSKSLAGKISKVKEALKPKETATVTDVSTGEKRLANGAVYDHLEEQAKKKKKIKHDSEDGEIMAYFPARDENSLEHHGILGMKWGVRRFQNPDGSLTAKGRARMNDVANSKLKSKIDTDIARGVYKHNAGNASAAAVTQSKRAVKFQKKSEKYAEGTKKHEELLNKSKEATERSKEFSKLADIATKKVADIDNGTVKAGRDFIVQKDLNIQLTRFPTYKAMIDEFYNPQLGKQTTSNYWLGSNEYRVIEKKK